MEELVHANRSIDGSTMIGRLGDGHLTIDGGTFLVGHPDSIGTLNPSNDDSHFQLGGSEIASSSGHGQPDAGKRTSA